jgi:hypothetical protein
MSSGALRLTLAPLLGAVMLTAAHAQFEPDVPYVTTPWVVVENILDIAAVKPGDYLIDLGSGDGRIVIEAAKTRGASGAGIELVSNLVRIAQEEARRAGVADKATFNQGSLFDFELGRASVLTMYLYPQINIRLRPRLFEQLKPGTRVVSHDFAMDEWLPDAQREVPVPGKSYGAPRSMIYLWVMPAHAAGVWRWQMAGEQGSVAYEATISQRFQKLAMAVRVDGVPVKVEEVELRGERIRFALTREIAGQPVTHEFSARLDGDSAAGTAATGRAGGAAIEWKAQRAERGTMRLE